MWKECLSWNNDFSTITEKKGSGKNHQWMWNQGEIFDEEKEACLHGLKPPYGVQEKI